MTRREAMLACSAAAIGSARGGSRGPVRMVSVPEGGLQPQAAVDERGVLHLIYFAGDARHGDVFYTRSENGGAAFSSPLRINSQTGSAIAIGTIRGAQLAVGRGGRVHVAWNGSAEAAPPGPVNPDSGKPGAPMLYSRLNDVGTAFEPQRNLMIHSFGLDGGGSVAADSEGEVYVAWHGIGTAEAGGKAAGEARRAVWLAQSEDDGRRFSAEHKAWPAPTGACGCCGLKAFADRQGNVWVLYRSATESVHRDIYLLGSHDRGRTFQGKLLGRWDINACPMSSMDIAANGRETVGAWENGGQVYWTHLARDAASARKPIAAPGEGKGRKHPRIAINGRGEVLLVWTEGTGWQKGGSLAWQIFDGAERPAGEPNELPGIVAWSFAAAVALPGGDFAIVR